MRGLFHIHSNYSFDSFMKPEIIVDYAIRNDFDVLSITDHNTIMGSLIAKKYNSSQKLQIIIGAEYTTDKGDIIGLFLDEEIKSNISEKVIDDIKKQSGIVVLPHPFKGHKLDEELIRSMDLIEVYNARNSIQNNDASRNLSKKYHKQFIAGIDAHFLKELGLVEVNFEVIDKSDSLKELILKADRKILCKENRIFEYFEIASQFVKSYKLKNIRLFSNVIKRLISKLGHDILLKI